MRDMDSSEWVWRKRQHFSAVHTACQAQKPHPPGSCVLNGKNGLELCDIVACTGDAHRCATVLDIEQHRCRSDAEAGAAEMGVEACLR
ncbi:MAG TPA: hypothetical protein DFR83_09555 [Deltaproteobacteria bacterium]|nr:hypothetical protein [Deltaproteobacteria bacterium]